MPAQRVNGRAKRKRAAPSVDSVDREEGPSTRRKKRPAAVKPSRRAQKRAHIASPPPAELSDCSSSLSSLVPSDVEESDEEMEWEEVNLAEAQVNVPQISSTSEGGNLDLTLDKSKNVQRLK